MFGKLLEFILQFLRGYRNYTKKPRLEPITDHDLRQINEEPAKPPALPPPEEPEAPVEEEDTAPVVPLPAPPEEERGPSIHDKIATLMESSQWEPPLEQLPRNRAELYKVFGDPGKGKISRAFKRKWLFVAKNFAGRWNKGRTRLYVHKLFEPYLRQALWLVKMAVGDGYITRLGSFNFRHARFNPDLPLSFHSWAAAVDFNGNDNRDVYRYKKWQRKVKGKWEDCPQAKADRGPVTLPYDKSWILTWPKGVPYEVVCCFLAVGLTWGATWRFPHSKWVYFVEKYGVGYDPVKLSGADRKLYEKTLEEWQRHSYIDPMHVEALDRQPRKRLSA